MEERKDFAVNGERTDGANIIRVGLRYERDYKCVRLHIIPMVKEEFEINGIEYERTTALFTGLIFKVAEMSRKSEKKFSELLAKLEPNFEKFARTFEKNPDWVAYDVRCALSE